MVNGTLWCRYLCPSPFSGYALSSLPLLAQFFDAQTRVQEGFQRVINQVLIDEWNLATSLVFAPIVEGLVYRGPLYLTRRTSHKFLWWLTGAALAIVFGLSHERGGLGLLPLLALGFSSLWLIATTGRFWPSVTLHFLQNFFFSSVLVYQSLWISD